MAAGFWTGVVVGWIVGAIIGYLARKGLGSVIKRYGGEAGTYFKNKEGKVTQQAFPAFRANQYYP
jgi:hypothetical protein